MIIGFVTLITLGLKEVSFWEMLEILYFVALEFTNHHGSLRYRDLINNDGKSSSLILK